MKNPILLNNSDLLKISSNLIEKSAAIRFRAKGFSMRPFIKDGDLITVSPLLNYPIRVGDVVLYKTSDDRAIVHRVTRKTTIAGRAVFFIKGDATFGQPEEVDTRMVLGRVTAIERNRLKRRLNTKLYRMIGLVFAMLSPFSRWIYPIGSRVKHKGRKLLGSLLVKLQSIKFYGFLAKKMMKENIHYQIAIPDDAHLISQFYMYDKRHELENPRDTLKEQLKNPEDSGYWLVAKQKDMVIGGVTLTKFQESNYPYEGWWLFGMKVKLRYRRMGIGEKLTKMAADVAAKQGATEIKLLVFEDAKPANNLYRKSGFLQVSIPELDRQLEKEAQENSRRRIIFLKDVKSMQNQNKTTLVNGHDLQNDRPSALMPL